MSATMPSEQSDCPPTKATTHPRVEAVAKKLHIPDWFTPSLTDKRLWKTFARCMVASFGSILIMVCQPSLNKIGSAGFFGAVLSQMLPPSMALSIYILAFSTVIVGMGVGWAWGAAAMAASLSARSSTLLAAQTQAFQASLDSTSTVTAQYQTAILRGDFLDPRSSAVFGAFLFIGAYFLGFVRATKPKLGLAVVFATIILDLMCTIGPLFPVSQYTLAKQLLIPAACFIGIGIASVILIFPQTLNHIVLDSLIQTVLTPSISVLELQGDILSTSPGDEVQWSQLSEKIYAKREEYAAAFTALQGQMGMLHLEVTRGQIGPGDLEKIFTKVKDLSGSLYGLTSFALLVEEQNQSHKRMKENPLPHPTLGVQKHIKRFEEHSHPSRSLEGLVPILNQSTADIRKASIKAMEDAKAWLSLANQTRWKKIPKSAPPIADREVNLENVRRALQEFRDSRQFELLEPYRDSFDADTGAIKPEWLEAYRYMTRDLFRSLILTSNTISFTLSLISFLEVLLDIERKNPKAKIQLPEKFASMLLKNANDKKGGGNALDMGLNDAEGADGSGKIDDDEDSDEANTEKKDEKNKKKLYKKLPDSSDPRNVFQRFGRHVYNLWLGLSGPSGVFALKYALVSVALFVPAVCPNSASFYYTNRGLWALIMSQTGMGIYTGEQILAFVLRMGGTATGLVIGMVAWYIGAQKGSGNAYGVTAATMVLIAPGLFIRIAIPVQKAVFFLMANVTIMFTVGYSWIDEHVTSSANQGSGASLAGRRALLVMIGFAAAFIMMMFPHPTSAKVLIRRRLAKNIGDLGDLYGKLVTALDEDIDREEWETILEDTSKEKGVTDDMRKEKRKAKLRDSFLKIIGRRMAIQPHLGYAAVEPGLTGPWPKKTYTALYETQGHLLATLGLLANVYSRMDEVWCKRLARRSDIMHPAFIGDCLLLFSTLQQALRTGEPLPPMIPIFERLSIVSKSSSQWAKTVPMSNGGSGEDGEQLSPIDSGSEVEDHMEKESGDRHRRKEEAGVGHVPGAPNEQDDLKEERRREVERKNAQKVMVGAITWDNCHNEQFALFASANTALVHIVISLNDMYSLVRELVGEKDLAGLDRASERWARRGLEEV